MMIKKLMLIALFCFLSLFLMSETDIKKRKRKPFYFAPSHLIKHFSFGFSDVYADILWMRLIQDIDFCNSQKGLPKYDGKIKYQCEKGWSFKMTDAITELAPRFLIPYEISGSIMSVMMRDKQGAKKIYDKAIKNFPNDWKIYFSAGYHYLLELKQEKRAAELLIQAADLGGPHWLYALVAKTYGKLGQLFLARDILIEAIKKDITGQYTKALKLRLKKVEQQIRKSKIRF